MPFAGLRSRPATATSQRRRSLIDKDPPGKPNAEHSRDAEGALQRLSLHLTKSNGDSFDPLFTHEPDEIASRRQSAAIRQSEEQEKKSASTPAALSSTKMMEGEQQPQPSSQPDQQFLRPEIKVQETDDEPLARPQRFSLLKFRHASDSQLSSRYKRPMASPPPELPRPTPSIIRTAPTDRADEPVKKGSLFGRDRSPLRKHHSFRNSVFGISKSDLQAPHPSASEGASTPNLRPVTEHGQHVQPHSSFQPPAYGDEAGSQLVTPVDRLSDSSRSDASGVYAQQTVTHTVSTTTTFFKLKRKKKDKGPLFPLPEKLPPPSGRTSFSKMAEGRKSMSPSRRSGTVRFDTPQSQPSPTISPMHSTLALTNAPYGSPGPSVLRKESTHSGHSTPSVTLIPPRLGARGRSSTMGSLGRSAEKLVDSVPPAPGSTRTSTSTSGRRSFGDLLSLPHRLRQNSTPPTRYGATNSPGTPGSKSNSLQITREAEPELVYPKRSEDDTPASYLEKLEAAVPRGSMATILCKTGEEFSRTCLRKYMRGFSYFGESLDIAIRKMLMEVELPKETQQIDRLLAGFADRYYECNPGIFTSTDETAFVAFSILLLHSDTHNKNNKRKMTKVDYFKNTQQGSVQVASDILGCFFDNICYTPFIHFEDEVAINSHRLAAPKPKKSLMRAKSSEKLRGPVDPYILILDNKLEVLRPSLKDVMDTQDTYKHYGTATSFDCKDLHKAFSKSAVLQIVSARSRPDAFSNQATISNPAEAQAGLVSIKVAKVGLLWRKDPKKKKAQRPWQEWGAILTDSKLYFFRDVSWTKRLIGQFESHAKLNNKNTLVFRPPLHSFDADAWMNMDDAVALMDTSYKRHKNAFTFIKHGGFEEVFLANSESDMNEWIAKLNYAATFRTAGIRVRGIIGPNYDGRQMQRKDSEISTVSAETPVKDSPNPAQKIDAQSAWEIAFYRRQLINERISDFDEKVAIAQKELDHLLRNARHLLVLLPIQAKTREAIILAAGRMSAKLRWTRVELWRTKTHREILARDLEAEGANAFPVPKGNTPQVTPIKSQQTLARTTTDTSHQTLSPVASVAPNSRRPSQPNIDRLVQPTPEPKASPTAISPTLSQRGFDKEDASSLKHKASIIASQKTRPDAEDPERQILKEAGLIGVDGAPSLKEKEKRPDTSESERDRVGAISPDFPKRDKGGSVRRTLQHSLRSSHGSLGHHSPSIHRHKKGRESGSSILSDEGTRSISGDSNELKRGTGSFILHGKKASVITMSSEWQQMSNEERTKLRIEEKKHGKDENAVEDATADGTASLASKRSSLVSPEESVPRPSMNTAATEEEFVDASPGNERPMPVKNESAFNRASQYVDAKSSPMRQDFGEEDVPRDGKGGLGVHGLVTEKGKEKEEVKDEDGHGHGSDPNDDDDSDDGD